MKIIVAGKIIEQVKEFCYLGSMISQSGLKSGGSWIRVKQISISTGKFPKNFNFFRQLKNSNFQAKNCPFTATSGQIVLFLFKSNHFRTYFLYMIRYNNISRPVHDSNDPPCDPHYDPPCPKSGGRGVDLS